ncbi:Protein of unknown function [Paractinoplanes atraurantiacus]|uniref:DUF2809 domain-containing protein n=2 Tax=Paractinoplanes atraurantiacus TaxID=1036182 RepID=A0A285K285_9ACTN|nr:Protein of unknown function [Actinoplanes atraurantiacus]
MAAIAAAGFLALALGIRLLAAGGGVLDSSGALAQYSGTALYASMVYAGVFLLFPTAKPAGAGLAAIGFCWTVELFQLTGVPADLSTRSTLARLALGVAFDPTDLIWYAAGVVPLVLLHRLAGTRTSALAR